MTISIRTAAIVVAWGLLSSGLLAKDQSATPQSNAPSGVVILIGCVDRLPAATPGGGNPTPSFKLIDVQPGSGTQMPIRPNAQFLLALSKTASAPIDFGKSQNQRVEVSGTISMPPATTPVPQAKPGQPVTEPLPTLTVASLKSISTECK